MMVREPRFRSPYLGRPRALRTPVLSVTRRHLGEPKPCGESVTYESKVIDALIPSNRHQSAIDSLHQGEHARVMGREQSVMIRRPLVSVVDDDESLRESLPDLVREFGYSAQAFSSAEAFLASDSVDQTRCLILDVSMPRGMSGPDLQRELSRRGLEIPIIFITAQGEETVRRRLLEQGAVACLIKPFSDTALLEALSAAFRVN